MRKGKVNMDEYYENIGILTCRLWEKMVSSTIDIGVSMLY